MQTLNCISSDLELSVWVLWAEDLMEGTYAQAFSWEKRRWKEDGRQLGRTGGCRSPTLGEKQEARKAGEEESRLQCPSARPQRSSPVKAAHVKNSCPQE